MKKYLLCLGLCLLGCAALPSGDAPASEEAATASAGTESEGSADLASPLWVVAEVRFPNPFSSLFYAFYTGEPLEYRVLLHNLGEEAVEVPKDLDIRSGLRVTGKESQALSMKGEDVPALAMIPKTLEPGQIAGAIFNLVDVFPDLEKPDVYTIEWSVAEWGANPVTVRIIPRFNPKADYEAVLETEDGEIRIDLLEKQAPTHVRNFVNLSRLGYYDNQVFHTSSRDRSIRTGAPLKDGVSSIGYRLPAEPSSRRHVPGAVSMFRDLGRPGKESDGSQFFICLTNLPNRDGKFTIFGQINEGFAVAKKIGAREPSADPSLPPGTPKDPAKIHRIIIVEKPPTAPAEG